MRRLRHSLVVTALASIVAITLFAAATSPLLQWRTPTYILGGFTGVLAMTLLPIQPLLASGLMPGASGARGRRLHRIVGATLIVAITLHVGGLWITSPPDVIDALTFTSPTPFATWGVIAMWAAFLAATLAVVKRRIGARFWRPAHSALVVVVVASTVVHAVQIEGTMEPASKTVLAITCIAATGLALYRMKPWSMLRKYHPRV